LVSRRETLILYCLARGIEEQLLQDTVGLTMRGDLARQREVVNSHGAWHIMAATETLSIWPERTDTRVGLYEYIRVQLGSRYRIGLRSKLQRGYRGMGWDPEPSKY
jgi:hypothetical protein